MSPVVRRSLTANALRYTAGAGLGMVGSILRVGLAARLLSADANGTWLGLQLLVAYGSQLHFGALFGMFRSIPLYAARGEVDKAIRVKRTCLTLVVVMSLVGFVVPLCLPLVRSNAPRMAYLVATGTLTAMTLIRSYYVTVFKAESRFGELSVSAALGSVVSILTIALIFSFGLSGLIWGMVAQAVVECAYLARGEWLRFGFDVAALGEQLGVGLLTLATTLLSTLLVSIDRTVMLQYLGASRTGLYYLGANAIALMPILAGLPSAVLTPRFFEQFGRTGRPEDLRALVEIPVQAAGVAFAVVIGAGELALAPAVHLLWPHLAGGNLAVRIALLATYPLVLSGLVSNVFYALNRQVVHVLILLGAALVSYVVGVALVSAWPSVTSAAVAGCIGIWVYYVVGVVVAFRMMAASARGVSVLASSIIPLALVGAFVVAMRVAVARIVAPDSIAFACCAELCFAAPMGLWLVRTIRTARSRAASAI